MFIDGKKKVKKKAKNNNKIETTKVFVRDFSDRSFFQVSASRFWQILFLTPEKLNPKVRERLLSAGC